MFTFKINIKTYKFFADLLYSENQQKCTETGKRVRKAMEISSGLKGKMLEIGFETITVLWGHQSLLRNMF